MGTRTCYLGISLGPYKVIRKLGEGGMGSVWEAENPALGRHVAVKFLRPDYAKNSEYLRRFFNEARAANAVDHPGVVQIFDTGMLDDETPYLLMELLRGVTVEDAIAKKSPRGLGQLDALCIAWQVADVLAALHARGIVHRDLKPGNLMLLKDPLAPQGVRVKVLDLGLAKLRPELRSGINISLCGTVMGTPIYMAPEQCCDATTVDGQADVYSLGVLLYEMLAGEPPYLTSEYGAIMRMHMFAPIPSVRTLAPHVAGPVEELVTSLLQKQPGDRPAISAVRDRLAELSRAIARAEQSAPGQPAIAAASGPVPGMAPEAIPEPSDEAAGIDDTVLDATRVDLPRPTLRPLGPLEKITEPHLPDDNATYIAGLRGLVPALHARLPVLPWARHEAGVFRVVLCILSLLLLLS